MYLLRFITGFHISRIGPVLENTTEVDISSTRWVYKSSSRTSDGFPRKLGSSYRWRCVKSVRKRTYNTRISFQGSQPLKRWIPWLSNWLTQRNRFPSLGNVQLLISRRTVRGIKNTSACAVSGRAFLSFIADGVHVLMLHQHRGGRPALIVACRQPTMWLAPAR